MTLGEEIAAQRKRHNLSQGDLAEKMEVSRQSISKWETDASIPELDKLIRLSELFHVSIDDLVRTGEIPDSSDREVLPIDNDTVPPDSAAALRVFGSTRRRVGAALVAVGLLCSVLGVFFLNVTGFFGIYVFLCGMVCIAVKKYVALAIAWLTVLPLALLSADLKLLLKDQISPAIVWIVWLFVLLTAAFTIWTIHKSRKEKEQKKP